MGGRTRLQQMEHFHNVMHCISAVNAPHIFFCDAKFAFFPLRATFVAISVRWDAYASFKCVCVCVSKQKLQHSEQLKGDFCKGHHHSCTAVNNAAEIQLCPEYRHSCNV